MPLFKKAFAENKAASATRSNRRQLPRHAVGLGHPWLRARVDCQTGDYAATVEALLEAGAKPPDKSGGTEALRKVLRRHGVKD